MPLHKEPAEEGTPRFKRHHGEKPGETPPSSAPSSLLPAAEKEQPKSTPPWGEKPWTRGRIQPGAGAVFPEDPRTAMGLNSRPSGEGDSAAPGSPPQQGPPSIPAGEAPRGSVPGAPPGPQEDSASASHAGGSTVAEEGASAPAGNSSSQRPPSPGNPPPHAQKDLRRAPQVPKSHISATQDKGPGRGPNPRATPGQPPRLSLDPHLPPSRARSRNQRQHQPRGGGRGPRPSHHLFVDQPGLRGPAEPDIWLLHRGSPVPLHAGGQRPQAEPPQWNLYAPGTETFHCEGESRQFRACRQQVSPRYPWCTAWCLSLEKLHGNGAAYWAEW